MFLSSFCTDIYFCIYIKIKTNKLKALENEQPLLFTVAIFQVMS